MLKNSYLLAKIGADTAENEQHFAEILPLRGCDRVHAAPAGSVGSASAPAPDRGPGGLRRGPSRDDATADRQHFSKM